MLIHHQSIIEREIDQEHGETRGKGERGYCNKILKLERHMGVECTIYQCKRKRNHGTENKLKLRREGRWRKCNPDMRVSWALGNNKSGNTPPFQRQDRQQTWRASRSCELHLCEVDDVHEFQQLWTGMRLGQRYVNCSSTNLGAWVLVAVAAGAGATRDANGTGREGSTTISIFIGRSREFQVESGRG